MLALSLGLTGASVAHGQSTTARLEKNYVEAAPQGGLTLTSAGDRAGGLVGFTVGYARRVSDGFAIGPGLSVFFAVPGIRPTTGYALLLKAMLGDLAVRRLAFLVEAGGGSQGPAGSYFQANAGVYLKGFVLKAGYVLYAGAAHTALLSAGYTFSW